MELTSDTVALNRIIPWPDNPRTERADDTVIQMAKNIKHQGMIMRMMVLPAQNGFFYAVDGETRRQALNYLVNEGDLEADAPVNVTHIPASTPTSQVMALAIAANTIRHDMGPVDYFTAFSKLAHEGMNPSRIADMFNMSIKEVRGLLALADLIPEALDMVRSGRRTVAWAQAMTMASPTQQQRIVTRIEANPHEFETRESVKADISNAGIPESSALFDASLLSESLALDLFSEVYSNGVFTDVDAFWELQNIEIEKLCDQHRLTHKEVRLIRGHRFNDAGWTSGGDPATSVAVVIVHDDGSVTEKLGMVPPADQIETDEETSAFLQILGDNDPDDALSLGDVANNQTDQPSVRNPLGKSTRETTVYLDEQVRIGMRINIADNTRLAKASLVASTVTRNSQLATPLATIGITNNGETALTAAHMALQHMRDRRDAIATRHGIAGNSNLPAVLSRLMQLEDEELDILFNWAVAESCRISLDDTGAAIYEAAGMEIMSDWTIDQAYLNSLSNMQIRRLADEYLPANKRMSPKASIQSVRSAITTHAQELEQQAGWASQGGHWLPPQVTQYAGCPNAPAQTVPPADLSDDQLLAA